MEPSWNENGWRSEGPAETRRGKEERKEEKKRRKKIIKIKKNAAATKKQHDSSSRKITTRRLIDIQQFFFFNYYFFTRIIIIDWVVQFFSFLKTLSASFFNNRFARASSRIFCKTLKNRRTQQYVKNEGGSCLVLWKKCMSTKMQSS